MSTRKTILTLALTLTTFALNTPLAGAHPTRELTGSFGHFANPESIAVDLETGNVYVADNESNIVDVFSATGGPPSGGVPVQITSVHFDKNEKAGIAVDNSCYEHEPRLTGNACEEYDPHYGDVYVTAIGEGQHSIDEFKLNPKGEYEQVGEISGDSTRNQGVAVDSRGDVYFVSIFDSAVKERKTSGEIVEIPQDILTKNGGILTYVAVDDQGSVYLSQEYEFGGSAGERGVARLRVGAGGEVLSEEVFVPPHGGVYRVLAVDRGTSNVDIGEGNHIAEYNEAGMLQLEFGSGEPAGGSLMGESAVKGIAVNSVTGQVYVVNASGGDVDVFGAVLAAPVVPEVQPVASDPQRTSVLLAGTADPEGGGGSYYYQYVSAGEYEPGAADPYAAGVRTATGTLPAGHADESIERVVLTGLKPGTAYHYRLVVSNATGTSYGPDQRFTTAPATPPVAGTGVAVEVGATSATLTGTVSPRGLPTSYAFEVGTDTSYAGAKLFGNAGEGTGEEPVSVMLRFLIPGTTYHYRLVASSFDGTSYGQDATFTTPAVPSPVRQPAGTPLLASPSVVFPSIAGAITGPVGGAPKPRKALTGAQKLAATLRACRKESGKRRAGCEARARKAHPQTKTNDSKKR
jgi:hypothetical protein